MLFSRAVADLELSAQRAAMIEGVLALFRIAFPTLVFEFVPSAPQVNAQARYESGRRIVALYGGLAAHPSLTCEGIAFALLHEAGHHLSPGERLPWDPRLACECAADAWAFAKGAAAFAVASGSSLNLKIGSAEIAAILAAEDEFARRSGNAADVDRGGCWSHRAAARIRFFGEPGRAPPSPCELAELVLSETGMRRPIDQTQAGS